MVRRFVPRTEPAILASGPFLFSALVFSSLHRKVGISVGFSSLHSLFGGVDISALCGTYIPLLVYTCTIYIISWFFFFYFPLLLSLYIVDNTSRSLSHHAGLIAFSCSDLADKEDDGYFGRFPSPSVSVSWDLCLGW